MKTHDLMKVLWPLAHGHGYIRHGLLVWRPSAGICRLIQLQQSRWAGGVFINCGATPTAMVTHERPPGHGCWGIELRPTEWEGPYYVDFLACEQDRGGTMVASRLSGALEWLLDWMEDSFAEDNLRATLMTPGSFLGLRATLMLKDWAYGTLKAPRQYFQGVDYYD